MKKHLVISTLLFCTNLAFAQQEPFSMMYWNNYMHINPAFTGLLYKSEANLRHNNTFQEASHEYTQTANYAQRLDKIHSGIGVSYEYSRLYTQETNTALVSYAYHVPIKKITLSIGASVGVFDYNINTRGIKNVDFSNYPPSKVSYKPIFQSDLGVALHHEKFNIGISYTQVPGLSTGNDSINYTQAPHFWLVGDYTFKLGENIKLTPRIQFVNGNQFNYAMTYLNLTLHDKFTVGPMISMTGRLSETTYGVSIGYDFWDKLRVAYAFAYYKDAFDYMYNHHELLLSFHMK